MKDKKITLDKLPMDLEGIVEEVLCDGQTKRRLLDLGLIKGTKIKPVLISPSKDPRAYEFRGNLIAIREEDSSKIKIIF